MPDEEEGIERRALTLSYHLASNSSGKRLASERSLDVKRSVKTEGNSESNHQREGRGNMSSMSQRKGKKTRRYKPDHRSNSTPSSKPQAMLMVVVRQNKESLSSLKPVFRTVPRLEPRGEKETRQFDPRVLRSFKLTRSMYRFAHEA